MKPPDCNLDSIRRIDENFLSKSWANMEELEVDNSLEDNNEGFQQVISRRQKVLNRPGLN